MSPRAVIPPRRPAVIAHRGDSTGCPENSHAAFLAAAASQVDGCELDLRPTRDGQVVVCHDASLHRFGGSRRPLARMTLDEAQAVDVGSWFHPRFHQERLLSLDALLSGFAARMTLLLELKAAAGPLARGRNRRLVRETVAAIQRHRAQRQVLILCFNTTLLADVAALDPTLRLVRNTALRPRSVARFLARQPPLHAIDIDRRALTRPFVDDCHAHGVRVFTWSCNTPSELARVRELQVDGVLSDRPGWLAEQVRDHG